MDGSKANPTPSAGLSIDRSRRPSKPRHDSWLTTFPWSPFSFFVSLTRPSVTPKFLFPQFWIRRACSGTAPTPCWPLVSAHFPGQDSALLAGENLGMPAEGKRTGWGKKKTKTKIGKKKVEKQQDATCSPVGV